MTFEQLAIQAASLTNEQRVKLFFTLLGKLDGFYRYDFDSEKSLSKVDALNLVSEAINEAD